MLLSDVAGNVGTAPPAHMVSEVPNANVGVMFGVTVRVKVAVVAHCPAVGVNVYVPEFWLSTVAGLHVPVMLLSDVAGNVGTTPPAHMVSEVPKLNVGVMFGFTVIVNVVVVAHCPDVGVNVYVPEFWLFTVAGLHVPLIPLVDVVGNVGTAAPAQIVAVVPKLNAGVIIGLTITFLVTAIPHCPAAGVNV